MNMTYLCSCILTCDVLLLTMCTPDQVRYGRFQMRNKGRNIKNIADSNKALILKLIYTGQCTTRVELSRITGLTKMTVSNIVHSLIESRLIMEGEYRTNNCAGRNPVLICPDETANRVLGVYISRDKVVVSSITPRAVVTRSIEFRLDHSYDARDLMQAIVENIESIFLAEGKERFMGIGVSCIGPVDINYGRLLTPTDFYGISDVEIKKILTKKTGLDVVVDNDMNASALAELLYGNGTDCGNFIYIGITHGIGAGIVINGELYSGAHGLCGELGHISIDHHGPLCSCGNKGCLEVYASIPNFLAHVVGEASKIERSVLRKKEMITFKDVVDAAEGNDRLALKMMDDFIANLATAMISGIHILDPEKIFIGHDAGLGGAWFAGRVEKEINRKMLFKEDHKVKVGISAFGEVSPVIGSGVLYLNKMFHSLR